MNYLLLLRYTLLSISVAFGVYQGAHPETGVTSPGWMVRVARWSDPAYCAEAGLRLELSDNKGRVQSFEPNLGHLSVIQRNQIWEVDPEPGEYALTVEVTNCAGGVKKTKPLSVFIGVSEIYRSLLLVPRGSSDSFELEYAKITTHLDASAFIEVSWGDEVSVRNSSKDGLEICRPEIPFEVEVDGEWISAVAFSWPESSTTIDGGQVVRLKNVAPLEVALTNQQEIPERGRLKFYLSSKEVNELDWRSHDRARPFRISPPCDIYYVGVELPSTGSGGPLQIRWDREGAYERAVRETRDLISNVIVSSLTNHRRLYGAYPESLGLNHLDVDVLAAGSDTAGTFPTRDAWDRPFLYWSDGQYFMVVSGGPDKELDFDRTEHLRGSNAVQSYFVSVCASVGDDVVFVTDNFCEWSRYGRQ